MCWLFIRMRERLRLGNARPLPEGNASKPLNRRYDLIVAHVPFGILGNCQLMLAMRSVSSSSSHRSSVPTSSGFEGLSM